MRKYYEALWYEGWEEENQTFKGDPKWKQFSSKKKVLEFYEKHKEDKDKVGWWITYRDEDGCVIYDIVY